MLTVLDNIRQRFGDDVLTDPGRLIVLMSDEAPELRNPIRALAAALAAGTADRLRASRDPAGDAARLAAEIAAAHGIDAHAARVGVDLAARVGGASVALPAAYPIPGPAPAAPARTEWVGASTPMPGPVPPAATPAAGMAEFAGKLKNKWVLGGAAALVALYLFNNQRPSPAPQPAPRAQPAPQAPAPQQPVQPVPTQQPAAPGNSGGLPLLSADPATASNTVIPVQQSQQGSVLNFGAPGPSGTLHGIIVVSNQGWGQALVGIATLGASQPETVSDPAPFQLQQGSGIISRVMLPHWQRDGINAGGICVVFWQHQGTDVQLHGSNLCLLAVRDNDCKQMIGCATVQ